MLANRSLAELNVARDLQVADDFPPRIGDIIDDRIAEVLGERDALLFRRRPSPVVAVLGLLFAMVTSVLLRHSTLAVCIVWPSMAAVCLAARAATPRRL